MNRLLTSVLCGLVGINAVMQAESSRPRLVVGIVVDQLRADYVEYLRDMFGDKGFRRLLNDGIYMRDVDFHQAVADPVAATGLIFTGAWPSATGIPSASVYDPQSKRSTGALADPATMGNYTSEGYSPNALRLSTIADEIAIDGAGLGAIYSVAADPQQAVIMSGHAGKGAVWIDDSNGRWASTTYYPDFPAAIGRINQYSPLAKRLDTLQWKPSRRLEDYPGIPAQKKYYPFRYTFPTNDRDVYRRFKQSAPVNAEVTDAAIECLRSLSLGKRGDAIDMLNVGYTAAPFKYVKDGDYRIELEDTYLRLDAQLGRLFEEIEKNVGLDNTLIFLTSTGYYDDATPDDPQFRIPTGDFSLRRAESLLNSFLTARYGNADYVDAIHGNQVYLDKKILEQKGLPLSEVSNEARDFLLKMSGVHDAFTLSDIASGTNPDTRALRYSVDSKTCGDIFLMINPGWNVIDDISYPSTNHPVRLGRTLTPAFLMGPGLRPVEINTPVEAVQLAPTVTSTLHIRSPNGAAARPLR